MGETNGHVITNGSTPTSEVHEFNGLLFDMDGTIFDSTDAVVKHWEKIGAQLGVDPKTILATSHGRRSIDIIREYDPTLANWEYICEVERTIPIEFGREAIELPGSRILLNSLSEAKVPWTIVTSGTHPLVKGWLDLMKLSNPVAPLVTAEQVKNGKPDPEGYAMGRERLGLPESAKCLVLEDSTAGVIAGKAAGCSVVAVATTHAVDQLRKAGADIIVRDLRDVVLRQYKGGFATIEFTNIIRSP